MEWTFGRCENYLESVSVGFVSCLIIVIIIPIFVILFSIVALILPLAGLLGMIKRK